VLRLGLICPARSLCCVEPSCHSWHRHLFRGFVYPLLAPLGANCFGCLPRLYLDPFADFAHRPTAAPSPGAHWRPPPGDLDCPFALAFSAAPLLSPAFAGSAPVFLARRSSDPRFSLQAFAGHGPTPTAAAVAPFSPPADEAARAWAMDEGSNAPSARTNETTAPQPSNRTPTSKKTF